MTKMRALYFLELWENTVVLLLSFLASELWYWHFFLKQSMCFDKITFKENLCSFKLASDIMWRQNVGGGWLFLNTGKGLLWINSFVCKSECQPDSMCNPVRLSVSATLCLMLPRAHFDMRIFLGEHDSSSYFDTCSTLLNGSWVEGVTPHMIKKRSVAGHSWTNKGLFVTGEHRPC